MPINSESDSQIQLLWKLFCVAKLALGLTGANEGRFGSAKLILYHPATCVCRCRRVCVSSERSAIREWRPKEKCSHESRTAKCTCRLAASSRTIRWERRYEAETDRHLRRHRSSRIRGTPGASCGSR